MLQVGEATCPPRFILPGAFTCRDADSTETAFDSVYHSDQRGPSCERRRHVHSLLPSRMDISCAASSSLNIES